MPAEVKRENGSLGIIFNADNLEERITKFFPKIAIEHHDLGDIKRTDYKLIRARDGAIIKLSLCKKIHENDKIFARVGMHTSASSEWIGYMKNVVAYELDEGEKKLSLYDWDGQAEGKPSIVISSDGMVTINHF